MSLLLSILVLSVAFVSIIFGFLIILRRNRQTVRPDLSREKIAESKLMWTEDEMDKEKSELWFYGKLSVPTPRPRINRPLTCNFLLSFSCCIQRLLVSLKIWAGNSNSKQWFELICSLQYRRSCWGVFSRAYSVYLMAKKSHAHLFTLFVYFKHLVPPTGLFWTNFSPCLSSQFCFPAISAKKCPSRWQ